MRKASLVLICLAIYSNLCSQSWDSLYQISQEAHSLFKSDLDSAELINNRVFENLESGAPDSLLCSAWFVKTSIEVYQGDYGEALDAGHELLRYAELCKDTLRILDAKIIIGIIHLNRKAFGEAINSIDESIDLIKMSAQLSDRLVSSPYNVKALIYKSQQQIDSTIHYYEKAISVLEGDTSKASNEMRAVLHNNLGDHYFNEENLDVAIIHLEYGIYYNKKLNRISGIAWNSNELASIYLKKRQLDSARKFILIADSLSRLSSMNELKKNIEYNRIRYVILSNQNDSAYRLLSNYNILMDSIILNKTKASISEAQAKYEVEKKEAALALSKKQEALAKSESRANKLYLAIAIIGLLVIVGAYLFTYRNYRQKRKIAILELKAQQREIDDLMQQQESESFAAMLKGQEEERERIAKDLHDQLGGTLAALKMTLRKEGNKVEPEDLETVDQAVVEVRNIAHNLSSGLLEKQGLGVALQELKKNIERSGKLKFNLFLQSGLSEVGQEAAIELYRIVQELTNNTIKHAQAKEINLQTNSNEESFNLIFEDDGMGFDKSRQTKGMGMRNIAARVKKINGSFHLDSQEGRGTIAIIEIEKKS